MMRTAARSVAALVLVLLVAGCGLLSWLQLWPGYSQRFSNPVAFQHWVVLKCAFTDKPDARDLPTGLPAVFTDLDRYIDIFLGYAGMNTGNLMDYYRDVTYGGLMFDTKSPTHWLSAGFDSAYPNNSNRLKRAELCASNAPASQVNFADYDGIIIVTNANEDAGAAGNGKQSVTINGTTYQLGVVDLGPNSFNTSFAAHEMGHGLGMPHSWDNTQNHCGGSAAAGEYCDQFDIMGGGYQFSWPNYPPFYHNTPGTGPGINLPNLIVLTGGAPGNSTVNPSLGIASYVYGDVPRIFILGALSHPESPYYMGVIISNPRFPNDLLTVEYRQGDGWDTGITLYSNSVLIHEFCENGYCKRNNLSETPYSFLQEGPTVPNGGYSGGWTAGTTFTDQQRRVTIAVQSTDTRSATATVVVSSF